MHKNFRRRKILTAKKRAICVPINGFALTANSALVARFVQTARASRPDVAGPRNVKKDG